MNTLINRLKLWLIELTLLSSMATMPVLWVIKQINGKISIGWMIAGILITLFAWFIWLVNDFSGFKSANIAGYLLTYIGILAVGYVIVRDTLMYLFDW